MFSQFFEKKKGTAFKSKAYTKRKRKSSSPNHSCTSMLRYFSGKSNSPSPNKLKRLNRRNSPYVSPRIKTKKMSYGKLLNLNHLRIRQSQSPRGGRSNILNFFKTRESNQSKKKSKKMRLDEYYIGGKGKSSRKLINILGDKKGAKKRRSRETSGPLNKSDNNLVGRKKSDLDRFMMSKRRLNKEFLQNAKNNNVERCLELISGSRKKNLADINCQDSEGWTALHHAAWNGNLKFLNILLYNDAQIEVKDNSGVNPLTLSVAKGHNGITQVLLKAGSDYLSRDSRGNTPLHYAAVQNNKKCLELILEKGGSLGVKNDDGLTPLDMASKDFKSHFLKGTKKRRSSRQKKMPEIEDAKPMIRTKSKNLLDRRSSGMQKKRSSKKILVKDGVKRDKEKKMMEKSKNIQNKSTRIDSAGVDSDSKKDIQASIGPKDFKVHTILGKGSFGEVYLVEKIDSKKIYAMKVLYKNNIIKHNLTRYAMTEKNVLSNIEHPFIVKLHYSFQTPDKLFMILDFCPGGDLGEHLQNEGRFSEDRSKIYICEVITALEELHKNDIIYRDLKPDNIVLDHEGHAMLTDFGLSKEEVSDYYKGAKSFCGSVAYLAPEMLKRLGHGKAVDWYLLGVVLYEMLVGLPPYYAESKDELFQNIENAPLRIPGHLSSNVKDLLKKLLERNPAKRLGSGSKGAEEIKSHTWFSEIMWDAVIQRKMKPPRIRKKIKLSRKNVPKDLFSVDKKGKEIKDWTFIEDLQQQQTNELI